MEAHKMGVCENKRLRYDNLDGFKKYLQYKKDFLQNTHWENADIGHVTKRFIGVSSRLSKPS